MKASDVIKHYGEKFSHPLCLVDYHQTDQPLIYVNEEFCRLTKYSSDEVFGRNCRILQGPLTDQQAVLRIKMAVAQRNPICQDVLNYTKHHDVFYNRLVLIPFTEKNHTFYVGLQHEISPDMFKAEHQTDHLELLDKTINPLSSLVGLLMFPTPNLESDLAASTKRIKDFVLSL